MSLIDNLHGNLSHLNAVSRINASKWRILYIFLLYSKNEPKLWFVFEISALGRKGFEVIPGYVGSSRPACTI